MRMRAKCGEGVCTACETRYNKAIRRARKSKGETNMEKEYIEKLDTLNAEQARALRAYLDTLMAKFNVSPTDQYTGAPAAAPPGADDHNPG